VADEAIAAALDARLTERKIAGDAECRRASEGPDRAAVDRRWAETFAKKDL
jgi:hypothetical protein